MVTMILISTVAVLVGLVGSAVIWGFDLLRADEIEHTAGQPAPVRPAVDGGHGEAPRPLGS